MREWRKARRKSRRRKKSARWPCWMRSRTTQRMSLRLGDFDDSAVCTDLPPLRRFASTTGLTSHIEIGVRIASQDVAWGVITADAVLAKMDWRLPL